MALESNIENNIVDKLVNHLDLPKMVKVKQTFNGDHIPQKDIPSAVVRELSRSELQEQIKPGMSIAITSGSRGVANVALVTKAIVDFVKSLGAHPFVFPAMGSHGGATPEGQLEVLTSYGVTEEYLGCPVRATMETVIVGYLDDGMPVYQDKYASEADGVILCGRIKAHTAFRGPNESGLMKMAVIGMGKQKGAETIHESGFNHMGALMPRVYKVLHDNANIIGGIGLVENAFDQTCIIKGMTKEEIITKEPSFLTIAKERMGRIWFDQLDVLVVDEIGKDISGDGMDPNITGRFACADSASGGIQTKRIVVLDLTEESHGNSNGVGMADVTTRRFLNKTNVDATYPNAVTSTVLDVVKMPFIANSDRTAIQVALRCCNETDKSRPYIVRVKNTLDIEEIYISEAMINDAISNPNVEIVGELTDWPFDEKGDLF